MDAFHCLISFGGTTAEIATPLTALVGFGVLGSVAATKLLRH
jgi:hypothetical protein